MLVLFASQPKVAQDPWMAQQLDLAALCSEFHRELHATSQDQHCECWKISANKSDAEAESDTVTKRNGGPVQFLADCGEILGSYWKLGRQFCNHEVWKLDESDLQAGTDAVFVYFWDGNEYGFGDDGMTGWYLATMVAPMSATKSNSTKDVAAIKNSADLRVFAYADPTGHEYVSFPQSFCVPAKSTEEARCISVTPAILHFSEEVNALTVLVQGLEAELGDKRGASQMLGEQLTGPAISAYVLHPGWFERCAGLVRLVTEGHFDKAQQLASELTSKKMARKIIEFMPMPSYVKMYVWAYRAHHGLRSPQIVHIEYTHTYMSTYNVNGTNMLSRTSVCVAHTEH